MTKVEVKSSNIKSYEYDTQTKTLEVEFVNGGVYHYHNVHPVVFASFETADSKGSYLHTMIKGKHTTVKRK